jgi:dienelactone hydrolase/uncharacterized protein (DUF2141 family)
MTTNNIHRSLVIALSMGLAGAFAPVALAQATAELTLTITDVQSSKGQMLVGLCNDPKAPFPGACQTGYQQVAPALAGDTVVKFTGVKPGDYAIQVVHDENGNRYPDIPKEGFAYGNDQNWPPDFAKASVHVEGKAIATTRMIYLDDNYMPKGSNRPAPVRAGSQGAAPPEGATRIDVRDNGLYAEFYVPATKAGKVQTLIVFGGSEGGLDIASTVSMGFVRQGYAVLAVAYFQEQGLPKFLEKIPAEYFDKALAWAQARPEVDANKIGVIGGSRGSEVALLVASRNKQVHAVMAFAPSNVLWAGLGQNLGKPAAAWTLDGKDLPFVTPDGAKYRSSEGLRPMFESAIAKGIPAETEIAVEKINGPVLLLSGEADQLWPSTPMADAVVARLKAKKFRFPVEHLHYAKVGHVVFMGDPAGRRASGGMTGGIVLGGEPDAGLAAWQDNWPKTLKFFDDALKVKR